jgi:hypothetical protein
MGICLFIRPEQASLFSLLQGTFLSEKAESSPSYGFCGSRSWRTGVVVYCEYELRGEGKILVSDRELDDFVPAVRFRHPSME